MSINAHVDSCTPLPCLQTLRHDKKPPSSSWCRRPSFLRKVALHLPMSHRWGSARSPAFCVAQGDPWRQVKAATHRKKATSWKTQCLSLRKLGPMKASVLSRIMIQHSWSITSQGTSEPASTLAGVSTAFIPVLLQLVMPIISCTLCRKSRGTVEESSSLVGRKSMFKSIISSISSLSHSDFSSMSCLALWSWWCPDVHFQKSKGHWAFVLLEQTACAVNIFEMLRRWHASLWWSSQT